MYRYFLFISCLLILVNAMGQDIPPVPITSDTVVKWELDTTRDIIVDDGLPGFWTQGNWFESRNEDNYWGHSYLAHDKGSGSGKAFWNPIIKSPGKYEIFINYTPHGNRAFNATYTIIHSNGTTMRSVNQKDPTIQWVSLGTYLFTADTTCMVILSDEADGFVIADAAIFSPREVKKTSSTNKEAVPRKP